MRKELSKQTALEESIFELYVEELNYHISRWVNKQGSNFNIHELIKFIEHGIGPVGTCAICGKGYIWGGYNPRPVVTDNDARCCEKCAVEVIQPARCKRIIGGHKYVQ